MEEKANRGEDSSKDKQKHFIRWMISRDKQPFLLGLRDYGMKRLKIWTWVGGGGGLPSTPGKFELDMHNGPLDNNAPLLVLWKKKQWHYYF